MKIQEIDKYLCHIHRKQYCHGTCETIMWNIQGDFITMAKVQLYAHKKISCEYYAYLLVTHLEMTKEVYEEL